MQHPSISSFGKERDPVLLTGIVQKVHGDDAKPRIRGPAGEDP